MVAPRSPEDERLPVVGADPIAVARVVNRALSGQLQNVGEVTLASGTTETVIRSPIFRATSVLILVPLSSAAAAISWWQDSRARGSITVGHSAPGSDLDFAWVVCG